MSYSASEDRYAKMIYNRCGNSGLLLPALSLVLWHNFGNIDNFENARNILRVAFDNGITLLIEQITMADRRIRLRKILEKYLKKIFFRTVMNSLFPPRQVGRCGPDLMEIGALKNIWLQAWIKV